MEKVTPNQPFTPKADDWNAFIDAANYVKNREMIEQVSSRDDQSASGIVMVQNVTDQTFPIFSCLYLSDLAISPEDSSEDDYFFQPIVFAASDSPDQTIPSNSKLCIIQQPLKPNEIGKAMIMGVTHAKVNILNLQHTFAVPDSNGTMKSADEGEIQILWQEGGSIGLQQCVLMLGGGSVAKGHPFDAEIINKGTEEDPDYYVRIYNSALPDSPYAGILYVGDSAFDISVAEIAINTQNGFFIDLSVSYTGSGSNPFTTSFNLRQYGTPISSSDTTYTVAVAEGKIPDVSSRMTSDITVTGRWV